MMGRKQSQNETLISNMVRQGDVLLVPSNGTSASPVTPPASDGSVVLAFGEATGHRHRFAAGGVELLELREAPERPTRHLTIVRSRGLLHDEHGPITIEPGTFDLPTQHEYTPRELRRVAD